MKNNRLQDLSYKVSKYFRPMQKWQCGGLEDGSQCSLGPDKKGQCWLMYQCQPNKNGDTWECTRSEQLGGKCKVGATPHGQCGQQRTPCKPVRNLRSRQVWFGAFALIIVTTIALATVVFDFWPSVTNAGQLSKHHAAFGYEDCTACHDVAAESRDTWVAKVFSSHINQDSKNCLACHGLGDDPLNPHALPLAQLQTLSEKAGNKISDLSSTNMSDKLSMLSFAKALRGDQPAELHCATCHIEHQGGMADITQISNQQCALCHTQEFDNFEGHAAFSHYPAKRRTPVIFSHNSHFNKHFKEEDQLEFAPQGCMTCHASDAFGEKMELTGFDQSCSACHAQETTAQSRAGEKGIAMLAIPALDTDTLQQRGVDIGEWPAQSDAELTPLTVLLIAKTDKQLDAHSGRLNELDLFDLREASDEDLQLVYRFAWRLKQFYYELQRGGAISLLAADDTALLQRQRLWGLLSPNLVDAVVASAFPKLEFEVEAWLQTGTPVFKVNKAPEKNTSAPAEKVVSDSAGDDDWLSGIATDDSENLFAEDGDSSDILNEDDLLGEASPDSQDLFAEAGDESDILNDGDLLGEGSSDSQDLFAEAEDESDILNDDDLLGEASALFDDDEVVEQAETKQTLPKQLSLEDRANVGGWFYEAYTLRYRPSGHADWLIKTWVDYLLDGVASNAQVLSLRNTFISEDQPGACFKCHSVETNDESNSGLKVNWYGIRTQANVHGFNRFAHKSHLELVSHPPSGSSMQGCQSCHTLNTDSDSSQSYKELDASVFESDYFDLKNETCATCHEKEEALQTCTLCHNYHIGEQGLIGVSDQIELQSP